MRPAGESGDKPDPRRVVVRFDEETWTRLDDKRHRARETFQSLGETFFLNWLEEGPLAPETLAIAIPRKHEGLVREFLLMLEDPDDAPVVRMITGHLRERIAQRERERNQK